MIVHLRLGTVAPVARVQAQEQRSTPGTYCGCSHVPPGLSARLLKDAETIAQMLGVEVCPSCLEAKADEDRLH